VIQYAQYAVGIALVAYALYLAVQKARGVLASGTGSKILPPPDDDVRIVSDLATRLRAQGKTPAVKLSLDLIAELLKPEEPRA
jgi:hypothetical protein